MSDEARTRARRLRAPVAAVRAGARGLASAGRAGAAQLAGHAASESRRRRLGFAVVALMLIVVPVTFNSAREASYSASVELAPRAVDGYPPVTDPAYYEVFLDDFQLHANMRENVDASPSDYDDATVRPTAGRRLRLTVTAEVPIRARDIVNELGPQLSEASRRHLERQVAGDMVKLEERLRSDGTSARERRRLRRRLRRLERLDPLKLQRIGVPARASAPPIRGWADEVADAAPGELPPRPNPVWAGLAGLLVALILWLIGLALFPPGRARPDSPVAP